MCCHYWRSRLVSHTSTPCVWCYCRCRWRRSRHVYQFKQLRFTQCYCRSSWFLCDSEKRAKFRGWQMQNATEVLHCDCSIRSFVRSLFQAHFSSQLSTALTHWIRSQPWRVGRVQCEENCSVVWWSHFYWFSIFSKDLCFMNAFSPSPSLSLPPASPFVLLHHLWSEFSGMFFLSVGSLLPCLNCCWRKTARRAEHTERISYISLCIRAVYAVLENLCDELFIMALRALDTIEHFNTHF